MLVLRDYQQLAADRIVRAWTRIRAILFVLATGGGKTVVFCQIIHEHNGAAAAVVHRREILSQIACSLAALDVKHRIIAPPKTIALIRRKQLRRFGRSYVDPNATTGVISVQTLTSHASQRNAALQRWLQQVTLCVFDEGHHYVKSGYWARAVEVVSHARLLFVTATPKRADGKGLGIDSDGFIEEMVEGPQTGQLIDAGYLSPFVYRAPASDVDISDIPITAKGDFDAREFRKRVVASHLVGDIIEHYRLYGRNERAIVFASDVETAGEIADAARQAGIAAIALSAKSGQAERDNALDDFENGAIKWLVNVDLFDEGFDVPAAAVCILARLTDSLAKYLQMIGRVLRPVYADGYDLNSAEGRKLAIAAGSKPYAIVIDPVRNWERGHGLPNWPRAWSLAGRERRTNGPSDTIAMRVCLSCTQPFEAYYKTCPYCGAVVKPAGRSSPDMVDGDLFELDLDAMNAIFKVQQQADMSVEDYTRDQIARRIPAIGRPPDLRRHETAKYRRRVLHELVGWWIGLQAGRDMGEIHRRFYHRFGVDIGTAFALNAADTDNLAQRIAQRFTEDIRP